MNLETNSTSNVAESCYAEVAVNVPLKSSLFTYLLPVHDSGHLSQFHRGKLLKVPLGRREEWGVVMNPALNPSSSSLKKDITYKELNAHNQLPYSLSEKELQLYQWAAQYYHYPLGKLIFDCLPNDLDKTGKVSFLQGKNLPFDYEVNHEQKKIISDISLFLEAKKKFQASLIHGITGSGKTTIYLELIKKVLKQNQSVILLLPEINLTPQLLKTFETHVDGPIYAYHSHLTPKEKLGLWQELMSSHEHGQKSEGPSSAKVIIGTRSAIFLPVSNLGLIIMDEEHDQSYKQDDRCPYHARDIAYKKAQLYQVPLVLGSATPALETYKAFTQNHFQKNSNSSSSTTKNTALIKPFHFFQLRERIGHSQLPTIEMIDMRIKKAEDEKYWPLTLQSLDLLKEALAKNEQALVFVNRLGYANYIQCKSCGHRFSCANCSTSLRYFKKKNHLACQYCDFILSVPDVCPECSCLDLKGQGFGTERIMTELQQYFPDKVIDRFDRDEIKTFKQLNAKLEKFHQQEIDILVGTQMLSKGHNFKKVNLVIILGIDSYLNYPDFRANEKIYQLLTQVAGRSGRFGQESKVIIQTLNPENELFQSIQQHESEQFFQNELEVREICQYPPFAKMSMLYLFSTSAAKCVEEAKKIEKLLHLFIQKHFPQVKMAGPKPTVIEKRVNQYSWCFMLKSPEINQLHNLLSTLLNNYFAPSGVKLKVDVDPYTFL